LIVQHLAMNETLLAEKLLHLVLAVADQGKNGLDAVVFSRLGELSDEFLGNPLRAVRWVNPDISIQAMVPGNPNSKFTGAAQHKPNDAVVDLGDQRRPVGPIASEISILFSQYSGRATPVWRSSMLTIAGRSRFPRFLT
jgi:hypothetical protein